MSRKLASVKRIGKIKPIEGADFIALAKIDNWECIVRKSDFSEGDKCVFFEPDSVLPEAEWSEVVKRYKYRVRTIKMRGVYSQGLAITLESCGVSGDTPVGTDLTKQLGVKKYDPEAVLERKQMKVQRVPMPHAWMMRWAPTRWLHRKLYPRAKGSWPRFSDWSIPKTDEERIQNIPQFEQITKDNYPRITEKLDGQSCTIFYKHDFRTGLFSRGLFGVCSRRVWYKTKIKNNWRDIAVSTGLEKSLPKFCKENRRSLAIQGEICGPGIQGNRYKLKEKQLFVFQIYDIDKGKYLTPFETFVICEQLGLQRVPKVSPDKNLVSADDYLQFADILDSKIAPGVPAEGVVIRLYTDPMFSCKAISRRYLIEKGGN